MRPVVPESTQLPENRFARSTAASENRFTRIDAASSVRIDSASRKPICRKQCDFHRPHRLSFQKTDLPESTRPVVPESTQLPENRFAASNAIFIARIDSAFRKPICPKQCGFRKPIGPNRRGQQCPNRLSYQKTDLPVTMRPLAPESTRPSAPESTRPPENPFAQIVVASWAGCIKE